MQRQLPSVLGALYEEQQQAIAERLDDFSRVPRERWFYELCFCLCTPQSSAVHAMQVQVTLQELDFFTNGQDVLHVLRDPASYIRFHNTKHSRLHQARMQWTTVEELLLTPFAHERDRRNALAQMVNGFGLKEASHFLRNIGRRGLAIIDRHLLTNLVTCGVYTDVPSVSTHDKYKYVELSFAMYADEVGIPMDELDLLFWCAQTGHILK